MRTKIIAAFPGTGKSYFAMSLSQISKITDLDTNDYIHGYDKNGKVINQAFPKNYIDSIKGVIGQTDILLIGCQPEVLNLLREEDASTILVYPDRRLKEEYMIRFHKRGDSQAFSRLLYDNWDQFLDYLESQGGERSILESGQYISDVIDVHR
ncbi:hypothetical protein EON76_01275 [bacterium]|nr:MAG: hypothetical protein EON76_01275 [bacterium]